MPLPIKPDWMRKEIYDELFVVADAMYHAVAYRIMQESERNLGENNQVSNPDAHKLAARIIQQEIADHQGTEP